MRDLLPSYAKKEDFVDKKLNDFIKLPIEDQREEVISEQERILFSLNLNNKYIMDLIKLEFEKDDFSVQPNGQKQEKTF